MKHFLKYTTVWISQNLAIPFWVVGHVHLSLNVYDDIHELIMSFGMHILVAIGFYYRLFRKQKKQMGRTKKRGGAKAHRKRVQARNARLKGEMNQMQKLWQEQMTASVGAIKS